MGRNVCQNVPPRNEQRNTGEKRARLQCVALWTTVMLTISELAQRLRSREISPVEITRACLNRIERLSPALNAFITVTGDSAMDDARHAEQEIGRGEWRS